MNGLRTLLIAPIQKVVFGTAGNRRREWRPRFSMPSQRLILAIGFAVLAVISAASIGLDVKSRSDAAWVNHTLEVSNKITGLRLLFQRAASAARGYRLTVDRSFMRKSSTRPDTPRTRSCTTAGSTRA
jgi:hypothetical protein